MDALAAQPADIVLLQEVFARGGVPDRMEVLFAEELGLSHWHFSGKGARGKKYGNVVASRYPLRRRRPNPDAPWPQLLARATVETPLGDVDAISVHMPNGAKNGWRKIETFDALAAILAREYKTPRIVGGDFNEPDRIGKNNEIISCIADLDGIVRATYRDVHGREHPCARWQSAVEGMLGPRSILRNAWLDRNPGCFTATHVVRGTPRFIDHVLVSRDDFRVVDSGFHHHWRKIQKGKGLSDHSAAWAIIQRSR